MDFSEWLGELRRIINSPTPRKVRNDLLSISELWPSRGVKLPRLELFQEILEAIVQLRHSRCYGRLDGEIWIMRLCLNHFLREIVFYDAPLGDDGEEILNPPLIEPAVVKLHTGIFKELADFALVAVKNPPKRETKSHLRNSQAFEMLGELSRRPEVKDEVLEGIEIARAIIKMPDDESAYHAIEFIDTCFFHWDKPVAADILAEMKALEERSKREDTVFKVNDLLIEHGEMDELSALDRMETLRESQ